jgi:hypothetical protein
MALSIRTSVKDFNDDKLQEEPAQASLPIQGITWAGFINSGERLHTPFPEASRVVGTSSSDGDDVALRGELRFFTASALTAQQNTTLDSVLQAHNSATLTTEQGRQAQDTSEMDQLFTVDRITYRDNIQTWDSLANIAQLILLCHSADGFNRAAFCFR